MEGGEKEKEEGGEEEGRKERKAIDRYRILLRRGDG